MVLHLLATTFPTNPHLEFLSKGPENHPFTHIHTHNMMDNEAGKSFQNNTNPNSRLLGCFDLREKWVQELRDKKQVKVIKVPTKYNVSDL